MKVGYNFIVIYVLVICNIVIPFSLALENENMDQLSSQNKEMIQDVVIENELNESEDTGITTKIYKSNSPISELLNENANLNINLESNILNKEELLGMKIMTSKDANRKLKSREQNKISHHDKSRFQFQLLLRPWLVFLVLIGALIAIFKLILIKKI